MKGALLVLSLVVVVTQALPVDPRRGPADLRLDKVAQVDDRMRRAPMPDTPGLDPDEYNRYWGEMARNNPAMMDHLKDLKPEELAKLHPRVSERMARSSEGIRNRLEEARRMNMDELRELQRLQQSMEGRNRRFSPDSEWIASQQALRDELPDNFDQEDIKKRMAEQRRVLEEIDRKRREEFEQYQLQLEHQRREKLKSMNEEQRLRAEQALQDQREKQKHHEKMYKPASKHQLEEVWEDDDGLKDEQFDPKTFFFLHDTNGDKILDPMELQALFYSEVKKAYGKNIDNMEMQEELARMREYALKQLDRNGDTLVTLQEFMSYTQGDKFDDNEEWQGVVDREETFTEEEMNKFEEGYEDYYDYEYDKEGNIVGFKTRPRNDDTKSSDQPAPQKPPAPEGGIKEMKGDIGADQHRTTPTAPEQQQQQQQQQQQHGERVPGQAQQGRGRDDGVPGGGQEEQQPPGEEGLPGQEQLHIQPAGTQREGQAQRFQKQDNS